MEVIRRPHAHTKLAYIRVPVTIVAACKRDLKSRKARVKGPDQEAVYAAFGRSVWEVYKLAEPHLEECQNPECVQLYVSKGWFTRQKYCSPRCSNIHNRKTRIFEERIHAAEVATYAREAELKKEDEIEYEDYEGVEAQEDDDGE
jgi:hypothetical protein